MVSTRLPVRSFPRWFVGSVQTGRSFRTPFSHRIERSFFFSRSSFDLVLPPRVAPLTFLDGLCNVEGKVVRKRSSARCVLFPPSLSLSQPPDQVSHMQHLRRSSFITIFLDLLSQTFASPIMKKRSETLKPVRSSSDTWVGTTLRWSLSSKASRVRFLP